MYCFKVCVFHMFIIVTKNKQRNCIILTLYMIEIRKNFIGLN